MPKGFQRELRVFEDGVEFWIPVQEVRVPTMKGELRPDEQVEGRHLFLVRETGGAAAGGGPPPRGRRGGACGPAYVDPRG